MIENIYSYLQDIAPSAYFIAQGIFTTFKYGIISVFFGLILGSLTGVYKLSANIIIRNLANFYTSIFRGTPLLIQLSVIYFGIPSITDWKISAFLAGIIAFSLNSGAYISEIIRGGILAIDKGQFEAAKVLNIPKYYIYKDIIAPQIIRNILPSLVNELINMLKESSIISMIGEADLMYRAQLVSAETYRYFTPMLIAAFYYYLMVSALSYISNSLETKLKI